MSKKYFTEDTELAIVKYNNSTDSEERSNIYRTDIHSAFFKLTENLIHRYKFYYAAEDQTKLDNIEDLQHEVITFLLSKIHRFDPSKGAKAYSYFGTVAKRYLILHNNKAYKKKVDILSIEDSNHDEDEHYAFEGEDIPTELNNKNEKLSYFIDEFVKYVTDNIYELYPKEIDAKIADSVLELFRKREYIDIFNKKALYIFIREQIPFVKTPKITKIVDSLYELFKEKYIFYLENEYIKF